MIGLMFRSTLPELLCEKDVLRNFAKFTGKHLCWGLFFNKLANLRPNTLVQVFSYQFCEISKHIFQLLLYVFDSAISLESISSQKTLSHENNLGLLQKQNKNIAWVFLDHYFSTKSMHTDCATQRSGRVIWSENKQELLFII